MNTKISDLMPDVSPLAQAAVDEMEMKGIPHAVTSTLRTVDEQAALYAQGRETLDRVNALRKVAGMYEILASENTYTVTNCDGVNTKSNHQSGRAIDIVPLNDRGSPIWPPHSDPRWQPIVDVMKGRGFKWGGDFAGTFKDFPHYEMV